MATSKVLISTLYPGGTVAEIQDGVLLLADISGYTQYLGGVELDHCQDVLAKMIGAVSDQVQGLFQVAKLEGDAVFCFDPRGVCNDEMLVATIEACYFAFASFRRQVEINRACECDACRKVPELDLKLIAHYGSFVETKVAGRDELIGSDVVVAHRLLKNSVTQQTGLRGYALVTEACSRQLGLEASEMPEHREKYVELDEVVSRVYDLQSRWREEQERTSVVVSEEESVITTQCEVPVAPAVAWEYSTSPEKKLLWRIYDKRIDVPKGRTSRGVGTVTHCVMRLPYGTTVERFVDWKPYHYFTAIQRGRVGEFMYTTELEPLPGEAGTRLTTRFSPVDRRQRVTFRLFGRQWRRFLEQTTTKFVELVTHEATRPTTDNEPQS